MNPVSEGIDPQISPLAITIGSITSTVRSWGHADRKCTTKIDLSGRMVQGVSTTIKVNPVVENLRGFEKNKQVVCFRSEKYRSGCVNLTVVMIRVVHIIM